MTRVLLAYDVPGIQRYVFAPVRPMDIVGGSALLERFAESTHDIADRLGAATIFSGGGAGLFIVEDESRARELEFELTTAIAELTSQGANLVAASAALGDDVPSARAELRRALAARRLAWLIDRPSDVLVPAATSPRDVCAACGLELADRESHVGSGQDRDVEHIGPQCAARREEGRRRHQGESIRDLFPYEDAGESSEISPRGEVLATLYLDGDGIGRHLGHISDLDVLRETSASLAAGVRKAIDAWRTAFPELPLLMPVVGGDDVLAFCDARHAARLLHELWRELDRCVVLPDGFRARFSAALVLGDPYVPLRLHFAEAKTALETAKSASRLRGVAHVELRSLLVGRLHPGRGVSLTGFPLPREAFWGDDASTGASLRRTIELLGGVSPAQRSEIAHDLEETSVELRSLLLDWRAERADGVRLAIDAACELSACCGAGRDEVLSGTLALVELWSEAASA